MVSLENRAEKSGGLSEIQISLLRLFEQGIGEDEALEVRKMLVTYFDKKLQEELEQVVSAKQYSAQDYHKMLSDDNFAVK